MSTLHLNRSVPQSPKTVTLEDWFEELSDEASDPMNILIAEEEDLENEEIEEIIITATTATTTVQSTITTIPKVNIMSTKTQSAVKNSFDVKSFLALAQTMDGVEPKNSSRVACPEWLTIKNNLGCTQANAFFVTAGIVKSTRQIIDALNYTVTQHDAAVENLASLSKAAQLGPEMVKLSQQLHSTGTTTLDQVTQQVENLAKVIANGEHILGEIITWIDEHAESLDLEVETGHTISLGPIGNEIRKARREPLTWQTLLIGIQLQREFIRSNPGK